MNEECALAFIACQPRSGSTLLQKMLGTHPEIYTTSEPWLMLPPAYTLRENGCRAEYDADLAKNAIRSFWKSLPNGRGDYIEGMRRMYKYLYSQAVSESNAQIFLDKTPRYYLILSELKEVFPEARFVLLFRNPLAVLSSIIRTWVQEKWLKVANFKYDLVKAPQLLIEAQNELAESALCVRYEDIVRDPKSMISCLSEHIGVEFRVDMIEYGKGASEEWRFGDPESVYNRHQPHASSLEKWKNPANAQEWRLLRDYAEILGKDTFKALGYDYKKSVRRLDDVKPDRSKLRYTVSLEWLMRRDTYQGSRWQEHGVEVLTSIRKGGPMSVLSYIVTRTKDKLVSFNS